MSNPHKKFYILYDGRARCGDESDAMVLTTATNRNRAKRERWVGVNRKYRYYADSVWYSYDYSDDGETLINGTMRLDLSPLPPGLR